jgi:ketosteroid isomerase-like protein
MKTHLLRCALGVVTMATVAAGEPRMNSLSARDEAAIRTAIDKGIKALVARDWVNLALYADDAVMSPPNTPPKIGRAEIIEWNKAMAALAPVKEYRHEPTEIIGSGDFAFVRGRYTIVSEPENAPANTSTGSYFEVWRRQRDGSWKIHRNTWNSDAPAPSATGDEQAIRKIEQDWAAALVNGDAAYIEGITSPDWVRTSPDGELHTKAQTLAALKDGALRFRSFNLDDLEIRVSGDAAVVLGLVTAQGSYQGKGFGGRSRFTDTFVRRDGRWICVATHGSDVGRKLDDERDRAAAVGKQRD